MVSFLLIFFLSATFTARCYVFPQQWPLISRLTGAQYLEDLINPDNMLGQGGQGQAYETFYNGQPSAFKFIHLSHKLYVEQFHHEVFALSSNRGNPGIARFYGCIEGKHNGRHIGGIFMEKLELKVFDILPWIIKMLPSERFSLYIRWGGELLGLNKQGILHNDYSWTNLMVYANDWTNAKMIDLGISCRRGGLCAGGNPAFSPPEKVRQHNLLRGRDTFDSWAFNVFVIFLEIADTGYNEDSVPACVFGSSYTPACLENYKSELHSALVKVNSPLTDLLIRGLQYRAAARPTLFQLLQGISHAGRQARAAGY